VEEIQQEEGETDESSPETLFSFRGLGHGKRWISPTVSSILGPGLFHPFVQSFSRPYQTVPDSTRQYEAVVVTTSLPYIRNASETDSQSAVVVTICSSRLSAHTKNCEEEQGRTLSCPRNTYMPTDRPTTGNQVSRMPADSPIPYYT
jgi:hypothetical protein